MVDPVLVPGVAPSASRLRVEAIEVNAADHCNISCRSCSHASPDMPAAFADETAVHADLRGLAEWMEADHVRVLGGEPLLHPRLASLLQSITQSGISHRIRVLTNGLLLHSSPPDIWAQADEIHISAYPNTAAALDRRLAELTWLAKKYSTTLIVNRFENFRQTYRPAGGDAALTQQIYNSCQIGNVWRCLTVDGGRLYRCPQAMFLQKSYRGPMTSTGAGRDYIEITAVSSAEELLQWMRRSSPLSSCGRCAGSVGELHPHQQARRGVPLGLPRSIDQVYLAELQHDANADNGCLSQTEVLWESGA